MSLSGLKDDFDSTMRGRNLLDNPFFTINQRGASSYTAGIGVDRWHSGGGTTVVNSDNSLTITSSSESWVFYQVVEKLSYMLGKTVVLSAVLDGALYKGNFTFPSPAPSESTTDYIITISEKWKIAIICYADGTWAFALRHFGTTSDSITIKCAKVEVGTRCTLLNDTPPNYTTELLKCQRYLCVKGYACHFFARSSENNLLRAYLDTPALMRAKPTITFNITPTWFVNFVDKYSFSSATPVTVDYVNQQLAFNIQFPDTLTPYRPAVLSIDNYPLVMYISAEL